jgi:Na+/melibiose symporter-like transporter
MNSDTVLKHLAWITCVMVVLQVIFYFVFQIIGYNSFLLSITLIASVLVCLIVLFVWRVLKKAVSD